MSALLSSRAERREATRSRGIRRQYYVYILSSEKKTLYIGVTNDLPRRIWEHREDLIEGFSKQYAIRRLVYYGTTDDIRSAIAREKQLKSRRREKKEFLIRNMNPDWSDLYATIA